VIDPLDLVNSAPLNTLVEHASPKGAAYEDALKKFRKCYPAVSEMAEGFPAFGADAVRFYLGTNPPQAKRINLQLRQMERARNFANKIWNATRFALPYLEPLQASDEPITLDPSALSMADKWILSRLAATTGEVNRGIDEFRLDESTGAIRRFFWDELCDWYLELTKSVFNGGDERAKDSARKVLATCLETSMRLLHPFMPFVTEEVWQKLPASVRVGRANGAKAEHIIVAAFPQDRSAERDAAIERDMDLLQGAIVAARNIRAELGIRPKDPIKPTVRSPDAHTVDLLRRFEPAIRQLTNASEVTFEPASETRPKGVGYAVVHGIEVLVPIAGLIDVKNEAARLEREINKAAKDADKLQKQLGNESFVARAPKETVDAARAELAAVESKVKKLQEALVTVRETA
jgi:valyl-tRNA synthetase